MRSTFQQRVARLESAALQEHASPSGPVSAHSFLKQVETRMRLKRESLEQAFQALVVHLEDHELDALLAEAGISPENEPE